MIAWRVASTPDYVAGLLASVPSGPKPPAEGRRRRARRLDGSSVVGNRITVTLDRYLVSVGDRRDDVRSRTSTRLVFVGLGRVVEWVAMVDAYGVHSVVEPVVGHL